MKHLKRFFGTPKRMVVSIGCIAAALVVLGAGTAFALNVIAGRYSVKGGYQADAVTLDEAVSAALADAGLSGRDVTITKARRDSDHGIFVYDIEFCTGNTEYEYEIYEDTGVVYSKSKETVIMPDGVESVYVADSAAQSQDSASVGQTVQPDADAQQSGSSAQQSTDRPGTGAQQSGSQPGTGAQQSGSQPDAGSQPEAGQTQNAGNPDTDIGLEQAKVIALNHAGCSASEVQFSKAKMEKEHGSTVYEVEFYKNGIEYEYKIDAATGDILEFEAEMDD